jgi:hypothetical protein
LYVEQVRLWRLTCEQANARREVDAATRAQQHKTDKRRIKDLERELHRKEKALAEAAAKNIGRSRNRTRTSDCIVGAPDDDRGYPGGPGAGSTPSARL